MRILYRHGGKYEFDARVDDLEPVIDCRLGAPAEWNTLPVDSGKRAGGAINPGIMGAH
jgi:hypothetical protein